MRERTATTATRGCRARDFRSPRRGRGLARALGPALGAALALLWAHAAASAPGGAVDPELRLAYIDPGAGSFLVQALVAAAAGIAVTVRLYWKRIRRLLGMSVGVDEDDDPDEDGSVRPDGGG